MSTLTILRGIPASGKSTYAQQWVMEDPDNRVRINRDDIREALTGSTSNHSREKDVSQMEFDLTQRALRAGKDVMSDNTNLSTKFLPKTIKAAQRLGATVEHKDFPIPLKEALRRNANRERQVPEDVMKRMYSRLGPNGEFPVFPGSYPVKPFVKPSSKKPAVCFDMDGTLNDVRGVRHFLQGRQRDFDSFHRMSEFEPANDEVLQMAKDAHEAGFAVLITTARSEPYRETTQKWLDEHNVPYENIYMRPESDFRPDYEVKKDMYKNIIRHYDVVRCVDDNPQAIQAWRDYDVAVTVVPFVNEATGPISINNVFQTGNCVRCGKPFKGEGSLGPTCRTKA
jgi:predicted kinase